MATQNTITHSRQSRNLVQLDSRRWLSRSNPPKNADRPEAVVSGRVLADQEVDLAQRLEAEENEDPGARPGLDPHRVGKGDLGVVGDRRPDQHEPEQAEQQQELDPVPERQALARAARRSSPGGEPGGLRPSGVSATGFRITDS